jgi:hypothetical protein
MKKVIILLTFLLFICTLMNCATDDKKLQDSNAKYEKKLQDSNAKLLTQEDLIELFSKDRVVEFLTARGSAEGHYSPNGIQKIKWSGGADEGRYRIENGQFCSKWKAIREGKEQCHRIYHTNDDEYVWVKLDGSYDSTMVFKEY